MAVAAVLPTDSASIGIAVAITMGLIEVIKLLINKMGSEKSVLTAEEQNILKTLYIQHAKTDSDGRLLWYTPRSWETTQLKIVEAQEKIITMCNDISHSQGQFIKTLEKIENHYFENNKK